jgi:hypothetical protein
MDGWRRYLELRIKAKTGLSSGILVWAIVGFLCAALAFVFIIFVAYLALAEQIGPIMAALLLAATFFVVAVIALVACMTLRHRIQERAELALVARRPAPWLDPKLLGVAVQMSRRMDWRVLVPLLAIPLVAGLGLHWFGNHRLPKEMPPA